MIHANEPSGPPDLETRVNTRRAELIAKLLALKHETSLDAIEARKTLKLRLSELGQLVKEGVVDGWTNIADGVRRRIDGLLAAERPITSRPPDTD